MASDDSKPREKRRGSVALTPHFVPVPEWAAANGFGEITVYQWCRRSEDPIPHIRYGKNDRSVLIDDELAVAWLRARLGKGAVYDRMRDAVRSGVA